MLRYVALLWNSENPAAASTASTLASRLHDGPTAWSLKYGSSGLLLYCVGNGPAGADHHILGGDAGVVVGSIFKARRDAADEQPCAPARFTEAESLKIAASNGRWLVSASWGWYVAFLTQSAGREFSVLRSPLSELPCLHCQIGEVHLVFSSIEDFRALSVIRLRVNWDYIRNQIAYGYLAMKLGDIAIENIRSLEGGACLRILRDRTITETYWSPVSFAATGRRYDLREAAPSLSSAAKACVGTWTSMHESAAVRLSGGLDSSIVLSCASKSSAAPPRCLTYFSPGSRADERQYALAMAQRVKASLTQRQLRHHTSLDCMADVRVTRVPLCNFIDWHEYNWEQQWLRSNSVTALFTGTFGDSLFDKVCHLFPASDYILEHGIDRGLWPVITDLAALRGVSLWQIVGFCCRNSLRGAPKGPWNVYDVLLKRATMAYSFIDDDAYPESDHHTRLLLHGWLHNVSGCAPGKLCLIAALNTETFYEGQFMRPEDVPILPVLLSQPLLEVCLGIPTYLSIRGGRDRAVARDAFANELPSSILARPQKGSPDPWLRGVVEKNSAFIRQFLYEGILLRERLLDRRKLDRALLDPVGTEFPTYPGVILNLICTEAWVRAVSSSPT